MGEMNTLFLSLFNAYSNLAIEILVSKVLYDQSTAKNYIRAEGDINKETYVLKDQN